ncbi:MAG: GAF domain-containing protein [Gemmatimonadetes bacterium]|nr:GAF domain-containing protein [Gemmatimonadota bacterium]
MANDPFPFRRVLTLAPLIDYWRELAVSGGEAQSALAGRLIERAEAAPDLAAAIPDPATLERHRDLIDAMMMAVFPHAAGEETFGVAMVPFDLRPVYETPAFRAFGLLDHMRAQLHDPRLMDLRTTAAYHNVLAGAYGRLDLDTHVAMPFTARDPETGLDRHFNVTVEPHFLRVVTVGPRPDLSEAQIQRLLSDRMNLPLWMELIPASSFELHGFAIFNAVDVTEQYSLAALSSDLLRTDGMATPGRIERLEERLRTLFRRPELRLGLIALERDDVDAITGGRAIGRSLLLDQGQAPHCTNKAQSYYMRVLESRAPVWVSDLDCCSVRTGFEAHVRGLGMRNLLLAPLEVGDRMIGLLELASPNPGDLHALNAARIQEVVSLFAAALQRLLDEQETRVQAIIRQEYTAIHPAVEWRFRDAARRFLDEPDDERTGSEPIVFGEVVPLYGLSDIRGSSNHRNESIQADLLEQLGLARAAIASAHAERPLPALAELEHRLGGFVRGIEQGLRSGDEIRVLDFLRLELEDVFRQLEKLGNDTPAAIAAYRAALDPELGFVYRRRRQFEESVTLINDTIASTIDREQAEAQAMFPHYFEKFKTDGVDYNIYMGASLQRDGGFQPLYLRNLRLWQLMLMCRIVWALDRIAPRLSVPLEAAHLILVQSSPIAIRFRADEKRFDVDGAYNIRYEIVKKRIDKARVRGTRDQLTQPGHIAIVYSHPREAAEYTQYLDFLRAGGYVAGPVDELELEDLQGARGLEALRVRVAPEPGQPDPGIESRALAFAAGLTGN